MYPEVFFGPVGTTTVDGAITARNWLMLAGHFWHGLRSRAIAAGYNLSQMRFNPGALYGDAQFNDGPMVQGIVQPFCQDPQQGNLAPPSTAAALPSPGSKTYRSTAQG